jgi:hypothetical protein
MSVLGTFGQKKSIVGTGGNTHFALYPESLGGCGQNTPSFLTVAIQCLETAFGVTVEDSDLALPQTLPEIFEAAASGKVSPLSPTPTPKIKAAVAVSMRNPECHLCPHG